MKPKRICVFTAVLVLSAVISMTGLLTPKPVSSNEYSIDEAWDNLRFIAEEPRPNGSERLREVERFIVEKVESLGIPVRILEDQATGREGNTVILRNVYTELEGKDNRSVLFIAHYDSVPNSASAGDNGISVATLLECMRSLTKQPETGIKVLFTDAEELGLLGAYSFVNEHKELLNGVMYAVNVEGYGYGPMMPVEGSNLADLYFKSVPRPVGFSAISAIPDKGLRFDTKPFIGFGLPCITLATSTGSSRMHSPTDSFENADRNSVSFYVETVYSFMKKIALTDANQLEKEMSSGEKTYFMAAYGIMLSWGSLGNIIMLAAVIVIVFAMLKQLRSINKKQFIGALIGITVFPVATILVSRALFLLISVATWNRFIKIPFYKSGVTILSACILLSLLLPAIFYFRMLRKNGRELYLRISVSAVLAVIGCAAFICAPGIAYLPLFSAALISMRSLFGGILALLVAGFIAGMLFLPLLFISLTSLGAHIVTVALFSVFFLICYALNMD